MEWWTRGFMAVYLHLWSNVKIRDNWLNFLGFSLIQDSWPAYRFFKREMNIFEGFPVWKSAIFAKRRYPLKSVGEKRKESDLNGGGYRLRLINQSCDSNSGDFNFWKKDKYLEGCRKSLINGCLHPLSVSGNRICSTWAVLIIALKTSRLHEERGTEQAKLYLK